MAASDLNMLISGRLHEIHKNRKKIKGKREALSSLIERMLIFYLTPQRCLLYSTKYCLLLHYFENLHLHPQNQRLPDTRECHLCLGPSLNVPILPRVPICHFKDPVIWYTGNRNYHYLDSPVRIQAWSWNLNYIGYSDNLFSGDGWGPGPTRSLNGLKAIDHGIFSGLAEKAGVPLGCHWRSFWKLQLVQHAAACSNLSSCGNT